MAGGAVASVGETYVGEGWSNRLTQIELARSARLMRSARMLQASGFVSIRDEAMVGAGESLVSVFLGAGGMDCRIDGAITWHGASDYAEHGTALVSEGGQGRDGVVPLPPEA